MTDGTRGDGISSLDEVTSIEEVDGFLVVERRFSEDTGRVSFGVANLHARVPDLEGNRRKVERAARTLAQHKANVAVFPEFCLTGYFWEDEAACWDYMKRGALEEQYGWIERNLVPLLDENLREIVLNGLTEGPDGKFYNTTILVDQNFRGSLPANHYNKIFLPGIEKIYTASGGHDRMVVEGGRFGRYGFTTCYDYLFTNLLRQYAFEDQVDVILQLACWRGLSRRDYPGMNVRTDLYYGALWDVILPASSAMHQVWTIACNAVGRHEISGAAFWGGSGVWAPSGMKLFQASHVNEELFVIHNLDIVGERQTEKRDYDYAFDFNEVYRELAGAVSSSRIPGQ